jgi:catechol 2,3-dioxygenase-like lactoylglutathione lyase family enzyme
LSKPPTQVHFERSTPILRVENMDRALRFYVDILGFRNADWAFPDFTCVARDGAEIYLCVGNQGAGKAWVWLGVEDSEKLYEDLKGHDVTIRMTPTNFPWALEVHIEDPDGNVLRLGSEPREET